MKFKNKIICANGTKLSGYTYEFFPNTELRIIINTLHETIKKSTPQITRIDPSSIDSVLIIANKDKQTKKLNTIATQEFTKHWNQRQTERYCDKEFESTFYPTFEYKIIVYSNSKTTEYITFKNLITDSSKWVFLIAPKNKESLFNKLWTE